MTWWLERVAVFERDRLLNVGERVQLKLVVRRKTGYEQQDVWVTVTDVAAHAARGRFDSKHALIKRETVDFLPFHVAGVRQPEQPVQQTLW